LVGFLVGLFEGFFEGLTVGFAEGLKVGAVVGLFVGLRSDAVKAGNEHPEVLEHSLAIASANVVADPIELENAVDTALKRLDTVVAAAAVPLCNESKAKFGEAEIEMTIL